MYDLVIENVKLVTPQGVCAGGIALREGKIGALLEEGERPAAARYRDGEGGFLFPGAIDTHAHLNDPGYTWREDYSHGTAAAAVGGFTTVIDMPLQNEPALTTPELFDKKQEAVAGRARVDYCFWGGLVPDNFGQLEGLDEKGCVAFKSFLGPVSPDYAPLSYGQAYEAMESIEKFGGRAGFHCEDISTIQWLEKRMKEQGRLDWQAFLDSRPVAAEKIATLAVIEIARATGCKAHICHVSCPEVAEVIRQAQREGLDITAETCAHYLCMTQEDLLQKGPLFKCAPPLRSAAQRDGLWEYVADGTFSGIASDHSPCTWKEKHTQILGRRIENVFDVWGGISGIQSVFQAVFSEGCLKRGLPPEKLALAMCEKPARAFGLWGRKGALLPGFDGDLVLVDPNQEWEIREEDLCYQNPISAFVGMRGRGLPVAVWVRGELAAENGRPVGPEGRGRLVRKEKEGRK
ncbi:allantoinase AllB [Fournierella massiliensis]|nr:allantoinase AllB [Fournierella massiliensis]MCF2557436.1 allantoinase AllB [Fournierella massiliensis]